MRPEKVKLSCKHCGHEWLEPTTILIAARVVVYRDDANIVKRRLTCPNCNRGVIVDVPKAWLDHD